MGSAAHLYTRLLQHRMGEEDKGFALGGEGHLGSPFIGALHNIEHLFITEAIDVSLGSRAGNITEMQETILIKGGRVNSVIGECCHDLIIVQLHHDFYCIRIVRIIWLWIKDDEGISSQHWQYSSTSDSKLGAYDGDQVFLNH